MTQSIVRHNLPLFYESVLIEKEYVEKSPGFGGMGIVYSTVRFVSFHMNNLGHRLRREVSLQLIVLFVDFLDPTVV